MLRLTFHVPASRELVVNLEAREGFKIIGPLLLRCPESEVVARYVQPYWQIDGRNATHFECAQQSFVRFSDGDEARPPFGPFNHLRFEKSYCYADRILIAEIVIATERWRHCETGLRYRSIFVHEPR